MARHKTKMNAAELYEDMLTRALCYAPRIFADDNDRAAEFS